MADPNSFEVAVVGGGPAGMTTALYTTRLGQRTVLFEKPGGRHASVVDVHNLYGVSEDVSGRDLARHAVDQFVEYGGTYLLEAVDDVRRASDDVPAERDPGDEPFVVETANASVEAERVVFATGFTDVPPSVPDLRRFTGRGLHYCLHCDAYALGDGPVFVLGHDDHAAHAALVLLNVTGDVDLLLDGETPSWDDETERLLRAHPVDRIDRPVSGAYERDADGAEADGADEDDPWLGGLRFEDGAERDYLGGFALYGREYATGLAESLGCALAEDGAIDVDEVHETSVDGAYAVGDVTHGQNQTAIALGDGARAGVAIHKDLRRYPLSVADLDRGETVDDRDVPAAPVDHRARMRLVRDLDHHAGLRDPPPNR